MELFLKEFRSALRWLVKRPGFAASAIACLALGIGANSAAFSLVHGVLLKDLPYRTPERLLVVWGEIASLHLTQQPSSALEFFDYRERTQVFSQVAGIRAVNANLTGDEQPERVFGARVSQALFPMLGVEPLIGRGFTAEEDAFGAGKVVVLSEGLWRRRFGAERSLIGKSISFNGEPHVVVGVMPVSFGLGQGGRYDFWMPIALDRARVPQRDFRGMSVLARLADGVSLEQAQDAMDRLVADFQVEYPELYPKNSGWRVHLVPIRNALIGNLQILLLLLLGLVALVLLIACGNVANLLLARATERQKEIAVRAALGAENRDLLRQLAAESLLLALAGAVCGLVLAQLVLRALVHFAPESVPRLAEVSIDPVVMVFTLALSLATATFFSFVPFLRLSKPNLQGAFREGDTARSTAGRADSRIRSGLVVGEIALAVIVLVFAGLTIRSFLSLQTLAPGFKAEGVLTCQIFLAPNKYPQRHLYESFYNQVLERLRALPGVEQAAVVLDLPTGNRNFAVETEFEGHVRGTGEPLPMSDWRPVSPDYFAAMSIPVLVGRDFDATDTATSQGVAIVAQGVVDRFWPGQSPLGRRLKLTGRPGGLAQWLTVVGVVGDVKSLGLEAAVPLQVYTPFPQGGFPNLAVVVHTSGEPKRLAQEVRQAVWAVDRDQPVDALRPMTEVLADSMARRRSYAALMGLFAAVALVLVAIGVYSVMAYMVAQRTNEIGIRMALGAERRSVLALLLGKGLTLAGLGLGAGIALAVAFRGVLASQLYGVSAIDPLTYLVVLALLVGLTLAATYLPARRALTVDPVKALRRQ